MVHIVLLSNQAPGHKLSLKDQKANTVFFTIYKKQTGFAGLMVHFAVTDSAIVAIDTNGPVYDPIKSLFTRTGRGEVRVGPGPQFADLCLR